MDIVPYCKASPKEEDPSPNLPWSDMFRSASIRRPASPEPPPRSLEKNAHLPENRTFSDNPNVTLALYIAMAHAGLFLSLAVLYALSKLFQDFLRPIQWAILFSMPLRAIQKTLVEFWSYPLNLGFLETLLAIPIAIFKVISSTLMDLKLVGLRLISRKYQVSDDNSGKVGFAKLFQWLVAFGAFVFGYDILGFPLVLILPLMAFLSFFNSGFPDVNSTLSMIYSVKRTHNLSRRRFSGFFTDWVLKRLNFIVAVGLISSIIIGFLAGGIFFSYKIGLEGKDAVISLKTHLEESDYAEKIGLKQWINDNNIPVLIDTYSAKVHEQVLTQIDSLATQYNLTEFVDGVKPYLMQPAGPIQSNLPSIPPHPYTEKFHSIRTKVQNREWSEIYRELHAFSGEILITRGDLVEKLKGLALKGVTISRRVLSSSTLVMAGGANVFFSFFFKILSGAVDIMNFVSQSIVFFWLLFFLVTSESGGVMDHILGMIPLSKSTRVRCAEVLDRSISSVLLATAKVAFYQGFFTWLLFRFFKIHFLYMSTILAFLGPLLPIFPSWLSTIPAGAQLAMEGRYIQAVILCCVHLLAMDFGASAIQEEIPGQSAYLTGLSILGGMALFSSALEGAIMGPLLMTIMIALKNLYVEFVLDAMGKED
ncbi:transmembrane protein 245 [Amborella trichopoda]|uniref:Transmembrane protein 245 n=1 Tax=Amborella trichopoda TaxID=13333 RepID=U5D9M5_AMBTC|nr:transmembrane protein 245 [Amborella trichopoda]ERN19199.1 hypothetical protein AMTR_s00061p00184640 [Amborella trichopoda]|eukprot:XP_006857732.1 transmembrane protein 245 [Amborella trichopoda]